MKKVVLIGGGVGSSTFTRALKAFPIELTTIVSSFDDGGSTGAMRRDYGGIALGDFRQCIISSLDLDEKMDKTLNYRFGPGQLYSVNIGNVFLRAFLDQFSNQRQGVKELHKLLGMKNKVLPISYTFARLEAELVNGRRLENQDKIATYYSFSKAQIKNLGYSVPARINPEAQKAIINADYLIFAPGHFFTSILPHIFVKGFAEAWQKSKAKKIWIVNLLAHKGQDSFYTLKNYLEWFEKKLGKKPFDLAILNQPLSKKILNLVADRYSETKIKKEDLIYLNKKRISYEYANLASSTIRKQQPNDTVWRAPLRHDIPKIQQFFSKYFSKRLVLLDLDDTLINTPKLKGELFEFILKLKSLDAKKEIFAALKPFNKDRFIMLKKSRYRESRDTYNFYMNLFKKKRKYNFPGSVNFVKKLHKEYELWLLSYGYPPLQNRKLEQSELSQYIKNIVFAEERSKEKELEKIAIIKPEATILDDEPYVINKAKSLNLKTIQVKKGKKDTAYFRKLLQKI
jgi:uncharacterized cofD-like protein